MRNVGEFMDRWRGHALGCVCGGDRAPVRVRSATRSFSQHGTLPISVWNSKKENNILPPHPPDSDNRSPDSGDCRRLSDVHSPYLSVSRSPLLPRRTSAQPCSSKPRRRATAFRFLGWWCGFLGLASAVSLYKRLCQRAHDYLPVYAAGLCCPQGLAQLRYGVAFWHSRVGVRLSKDDVVCVCRERPYWFLRNSKCRMTPLIYQMCHSEVARDRVTQFCTVQSTRQWLVVPLSSERVLVRPTGVRRLVFLETSRLSERFPVASARSQF